MSGILIVGNSIKDVFLKLDEAQNHMEKDDQGTPWLNLGFDGKTYSFVRHTAIAGGAAVTQEVLTNFGIRSEIMGCNKEYCPIDYRFILNTDDEHVAYLAPGERAITRWVEPETAPAWIFVDRSAEMTEELMRDIIKYLDKNPATKLAILVSRETKTMETPLVAKAKIVFAENNDWVGGEGSITVKINDNSMSVGGKSIRWWTRRSDLMTHLTVNTIASTTFFAALLRGEPVEMALKLVQRNVEMAALDSSLTYTKMKQLISLKHAEKSDLRLVAQMLVDGDRGILAADESEKSIKKRLGSVGIEDSVEMRRAYRDLLFTAPNLADYINGVILFDETTRQSTEDGQNFVEFLTARGIIPGIKVDQGLVEVDGESITEGLSDLPGRLRDYQAMGLRFTKWRAAFKVGATLPSAKAIEKNCELMASYARVSQQAGLVPIVEPEVLYDGNYSLRRCAKVTEDVLRCLFEKLREEEVDLKACILKTNMILAGQHYSLRSTANEVGRETAKLLAAVVPAEIGGVVFLSGGQTPEQATNNYKAVKNFGRLPFPVTFSFARAVQGPALEAWKGEEKNREEAQRALIDRLNKIKN